MVPITSFKSTSTQHDVRFVDKAGFAFRHGCLVTDKTLPRCFLGFLVQIQSGYPPQLHHHVRIRSKKRNKKTKQYVDGPNNKLEVVKPMHDTTVDFIWEIQSRKCSMIVDLLAGAKK